MLIPNTKEFIEREISIKETELAKLKKRLIYCDYLDFSLCQRCGGSGWFWGGDWGMKRMNCTCPDSFNAQKKY